MRTKIEVNLIYCDGSGDILPDEGSAKWKDAAKIHCWLGGKPCVTFFSRRGTSDIFPVEIWRARTQVLAGRKKRRARAA